MHLRLLLTSASLIFTVGASQARATVPVTPVPPQAVLRAATVQVRVAPDHRDWSYQLGESVRFKVTVTADNEPHLEAVLQVLVSKMIKRKVDPKAIDRLQRLSSKSELSFAAFIGQLLKQADRSKS